MALDSRGLRHQTEASEAGSREPVGISRTTGVTKTCRATGAVAGSETWLAWKVEIIMYVASIHASISTSGLHPDLHWLRCRAPRSARTCIGRLPTRRRSAVGALNRPAAAGAPAAPPGPRDDANLMGVRSIGTVRLDCSSVEHADEAPVRRGDDGGPEVALCEALNQLVRGRVEADSARTGLHDVFGGRGCV